MNPYCFVITSFGKKDNLKDLSKKFLSKNVTDQVQQIDFDSIYEQLIKPALIKAALEPMIEREEITYGSIEKTMYEKILLCEFCIADLTNANPNAYYELGMRYAAKPNTTIPIIASSHFPLPFDIGGNRTFSYTVDENFNLVNLQNDIDALAAILINAKDKRSTDSPVYDMINGHKLHDDLSFSKTDVFRELIKYDEALKSNLEYARSIKTTEGKIDLPKCVEALHKIVEENKPLENVESAVLIDMMLSYKNIYAFSEMLVFIEQMPQYMFNTVMVQEQYAIALNKAAAIKEPADELMIEKAIRILTELQSDNKAGSESYSILGSIYKDKFDRAYQRNNAAEARSHLKKALALYETGFEKDMRDTYTGIYYITCLELYGEKQKLARVIHVVEFAIQLKLKAKEPDYWDLATLLELAVIGRKNEDLEELFYDAKDTASELWMLTATKNNLQKILNYRIERNEEVASLEKLITLFE